MTIRQALKLYPKIETELLLAHVLRTSKEFLFLHPEKELTPLQLKQFKTLSARRLKGEPIAYILGYKYFCGLKFLVNKNVLIPRPETEQLVERAMQIIERKKYSTVLDLGTGSGAIVISLAKELMHKQVKIFASDISQPALAVARKNAKLHKVRIQFIHANLLESIKQKFDLIIANLPYVPLADYKKLRGNLKYEPRIALTDNTNEFKIYRKLIKQLPGHLNFGATVLFEIDPAAKKYLPQYLKENGIKERPLFHKDYSGRTRFMELVF